MLGDVVFLTISIHAPREGCDQMRAKLRGLVDKFQSTHPARGATKPGGHLYWRESYFNPRTPRGVRRCPGPPLQRRSPGFQSTHPARGATRSGFLTPTVDQFQSTHPARGATFRCLDKKPLFGFQSTHPARGATRRYVCTNEGWRFQSTHPARGATSGHVAHLRLDAIISIHAPREGCDISYQ